MSAAASNLAWLTLNTPGPGPLGSLIIAASVAVAVLAYTTGLRWRQDAAPRRFVLLGLRLAAILCLLLTLLHPAWVSQRTGEHKPILAVVLDDSASMARPLPPERKQAPGQQSATRYQRAVALLRGGLLPALAGSHQLRLYDVEARALAADELPAAPAAARSPLTEALLRVQSDLADKPLAGIALLSDGAETTDRPGVGGPEQLRVPVYPIAVAGAPDRGSQAPDIALQAVAANRRALAGNTVRVAVDLGIRGAVGQAQVPLSLLHGGELVARRSITCPAGAGLTRAELEFVPARPGDFSYVVAAGPLPGETNLADNRRTFRLAVRAKPLTVLYIDGVLRWEGKFVRQALAADPDINVISVIRTAPPGSDRGSQGLLLPEQLASTDVVILGDVEAGYFSTSQELPALRAWVTEDGGGLVLTGGYRSFGPEGFGRTELRDILPVEFSAAARPQVEQPFNLRLTEAGRQHPIFQLSGERVRDTAFFNRLPALAGCSRIAAVKPGAEVLAVDPRVAGPDGRRGLPVMAVQQVGAGRSMVFAVDTTWRWRLVVGGFSGDSSFYQRFWGQLVRWMAAQPAETAAALRVATDRRRYRLGQTIVLKVRLEPRAGPVATQPAAAGWRVAAKALDERGRLAPVPLAELGRGRYRGTLAARSPGRMDLTVSAWPEPAAADDRQRPQSRTVTVQVQPQDIETLSPLPDPQWLAQLAQRSGGRVVQPEQIETWARQLPAQPVARTVRRTSGTWGDSLFGSAFLALVCAEWVLRRRSQLT